ncbi:MAG: cell wall hydrolase [Parvibaculum sp.]
MPELFDAQGRPIADPPRALPGMEQKPVSSAPFSPDLVSSFFMPSMSPQPTQAAAPRVGSFGWASFDEFAAKATELDVFARTLLGEAGGEGRRGIEAVAAVVINRVNSRRHPNSVRVICLQPSQFSMWNPKYRESGNTRRALSETDSNSTFKMCLEIASDALAGRLKDPTGGATLYYAPAGMNPPGSAPTTWNFSVLRKSAEIGGHIFYVEL